MNMSLEPKLIVKKQYILKVCESLTMIHKQKVLDISFDNNNLIIHMSNYINLLISKTEFNQILGDQIQSDMYIHNIKMGEWLINDQNITVNIFDFDYD